MPRVVKIVVAVFGVIGLLLGALAAYLFVDARRFAASAERAEGVVTQLIWETSRDNDGHRSSAAFPVIRFQAASEAVEFKSSSGANPPSYQVGDKVNVLYRPENPRDARVESFAGLYLGPTIVGGIAVVLGGVSAGTLLVAGLYVKRRRRALERGTPVRAKITALRLNTSYRVNGRSPWVVDAEYRDEALGKSYAFTSESLWTNPEVHYHVGEEVTVYYIPDEPKTYAFQLDKLPEQV